MKTKRHGSTKGSLLALALLVAAAGCAGRRSRTPTSSSRPGATVQTLFAAVNASHQNPKYIGEATACLDLGGLAGRPARPRSARRRAGRGPPRRGRRTPSASRKRSSATFMPFPARTAAGSACAGSRTAAGCSTATRWPRSRTMAAEAQEDPPGPKQGGGRPERRPRGRLAAGRLSHFPDLLFPRRFGSHPALPQPGRRPGRRPRGSRRAAGPQALPDHPAQPLRHLSGHTGFQLQRRLRLAVAAGGHDRAGAAAGRRPQGRVGVLPPDGSLHRRPVQRSSRIGLITKCCCPFPSDRLRPDLWRAPELWLRERTAGLGQGEPVPKPQCSASSCTSCWAASCWRGWPSP